MSGLRVAVPKGAIFEDALSALEGAGLPAGVVRQNGRRLVYTAGDTEFIVSRPSDVPVFVEARHLVPGENTLCLRFSRALPGEPGNRAAAGVWEIQLP